MTRKWNIPLTYQPKIEPVKLGKCTQTIRTGRKYSVGDLIRFYVWDGKPYRSKRHTITEYMPLIEVIDVYIGNCTFGYMSAGCGYHWNSPLIDEIARRDGIVPPTGEALRDVLISKNGKIPAEGIEAQIIRWDPAHQPGAGARAIPHQQPAGEEESKEAEV